MKKWKRKLEGKRGDFMFSGRIVFSEGIIRLLNIEDMAQIALTLRLAVLENDGLDYLQVFTDENGCTVWAIDQISQSMKDERQFNSEQMIANDYWTMLLPEEY